MNTALYCLVETPNNKDSLFYVNKGKFIWQLLEQEETRKATFQVLAVFNLRSHEKIRAEEEPKDLS